MLWPALIGRVDMELSLARQIGAAAKVARQALGLTQGEVAERIEISVEFYARMERGGTLPSVPTLVRMASALEVGADVLLGLQAAPRNAPRPVPVQTDSPEVRRLVRRVRRAKAHTVRLLSLMAAALER